MLNSKRDFFKDIDRIRSLSTVIDKKLSEVKPSDEDKIDKLTLEELQDLEKIAGIADFMLTKYADGPEYDRAQTSSINLTNFVTEINTVGYQQNSSGHNTR